MTTSKVYIFIFSLGGVESQNGVPLILRYVSSVLPGRKPHPWAASLCSGNHGQPGDDDQEVVVHDLLS